MLKSDNKKTSDNLKKMHSERPKALLSPWDFSQTGVLLYYPLKQYSEHHFTIHWLTKKLPQAFLETDSYNTRRGIKEKLFVCIFSFLPNLVR